MGRSCTPNPCQQRHARAIRNMDEQNCGTCREWTILGSIPKVPTATSPCQFFNNFFLLIDLLHQRVRCSSPQSQDGRLGGFNGFFNPDREAYDSDFRERRQVVVNIGDALNVHNFTGCDSSKRCMLCSRLWLLSVSLCFPDLLLVLPIAFSNTIKTNRFL